MPVPNDPPPQPDSGAPEFEDENPGSYLAELGTRRSSVILGAAVFLAVLSLGAVAHSTRLGPESQWYPLARFVWSLLPLACLLLLVVTLWQLGTAYTAKSPPRVLLALFFSLAGLGLWALFAWALDVLAALPAPPSE